VAIPATINSFNDCVNWALAKADEPADYVASPAAGTSDFAAQAAAMALEVFRDVAFRHPWSCLRKNPPGNFVSFPADLFQTLTIPNTGTNVVCTLSSNYTVPAQYNFATGGSLKGFKVKPPGGSIFAYIVAHTAGSNQITLDSVQDTMVVSPVVPQPITIYQDEYDLNSDCGALVSGIYTVFGYESYEWPEERIRTEYPGPIVASSWPPRAFSRIGRTRIRFSQFPNQGFRMEYQYNIDPADPLVTDPTGALSSAIPLDFNLRPIWALGTAAGLMLYKSDSRAQILRQDYEQKLDWAWIYEGRLLAPWQGKYSRQATRGPYA
jgi:hypothetical protein